MYSWDLLHWELYRGIVGVFANTIRILLYVTVHAKTLRKSADIFFVIEDFATPIFNIPLLQISYG